MNILLTGGSGFIGRNILESFLAHKYKIIAPSHKELDLTDEKSVAEFFNQNKIGVVLHAAGKPGYRNAKDLTGIFYTDTRMLLNLLRNEHQYKKMILLGSGAIYDQRYDIIKAKEEDSFNHLPVDEHALYRYASAKLIEGHKKVVELRIFGIFGKYENYAIRFISNAICKTLFNLPITIKQNRRFDYLYIDDLMPVLDYFIKNDPKYTVYNVTPDNSIELLDLAKVVLEASGKNLPIRIAREGMGLEYTGSNSRLKNEVPNLRFIPVKQTVTILYHWYQKNNDIINRKCLLADK